MTADPLSRGVLRSVSLHMIKCTNDPLTPALNRQQELKIKKENSPCFFCDIQTVFLCNKNKFRG